MSIRLLYIDLFCGAGGTSTGIEQARLNGERCAKVIACVNHDAGAIASHADNHPGTLHFAKELLSIVWPEVTHSKNPQKSLFSATKKWKAVRDVLDFSDEGESIFTRKKPLVDATLERIFSGLVKFVAGGKDVAILIEPEDTPAMIKIKEFMGLYGIVDIKMRMLRIPELKQIMGFPKDYTLIGSQADQKKFIGNAVEVTMAKVICEALCYQLSVGKHKAA